MSHAAYALTMVAAAGGGDKMESRFPRGRSKVEGDRHAAEYLDVPMYAPTEVLRELVEGSSF